MANRNEDDGEDLDYDEAINNQHDAGFTDSQIS